MRCVRLVAPPVSIRPVTPDHAQQMLKITRNFWMRCAESRTAGPGFAAFFPLAAPWGAALTYEAFCEGLIVDSPRGGNGFGYDPLFLYPPLGKTFAEMSEDEKLSVSHRGRALSELGSEFCEFLQWLKLRQEEEDARRGAKDMCMDR